MDESNRRNESRTLTEEFIEKIDKLTNSPSERAKVIWLALAAGADTKITNWDLICFCVETLGFMSTEFPWLKEAAMAASKIVYKAHYLNTDRILASENEINIKEKSMNVPKMTGE